MQEQMVPGALDPEALHEYIDKLQLAFASLDHDIYRTWFAPAEAA